jgi:hypothetical protein
MSNEKFDSNSFFFEDKDDDFPPFELFLKVEKEYDELELKENVATKNLNSFEFSLECKSHIVFGATERLPWNFLEMTSVRTIIFNFSFKYSK